jgi:hypothetical protein
MPRPPPLSLSGNSRVVLTHECLNWQPSQFINIVGKDDRAIPACAVGGGRADCCAAFLPAASASLAPVLPSIHLISSFPPAHPRIVAASSREELRGGLLQVSYSCLQRSSFPLSGTHASTLFSLTQTKQSRFVPYTSFLPSLLCLAPPPPCHCPGIAELY